MNKLFSGLLICMVILSGTSCKQTDVSKMSQNKKEKQISDSWKITYFLDKDKDETVDYAGYQFTFKDDGTFTATATGVNASGTWVLGADSDGDESGEMIISIAGNDQLDGLSDDWHITKLDDTALWLHDDSNSGTETEDVHFEKVN